MSDLLAKLSTCERGKIFLTQIARAKEQAEQAMPGLGLTLLKRFVSHCARQDLTRNDQGEFDIRNDIVKPLIWTDPETYYFRDSEEISLDPKIATVVSREIFFKMLDRRPDTTTTTGLSIEIASYRGDDFPPDARVGWNPDCGKDIVWVTRFGDLAALVPALETGEATTQEDVMAIRNHLGLCHFRRDSEMVLLVFDASTLQDQARHGPTTRPFLFEGVENRRFHLSERGEDNGWNRALNLKVASDPSVDPRGGYEIVMKSLSCSRIERCIYLGNPGPTPCEGRDPIVLGHMLEGRSFDTAKEAVANLLDGETG